MTDLIGQVAIVTGGGRGVGRAVALELAKAGAAVMVTARSKGEIEETAALIKAAGGKAATCTADVTKVTDLEAMVAKTEAELGVPTLLVNNAGGGVEGSSGYFETLDPAAILGGLQANLVAAMTLSRLVLPGMLEKGEGRIINVASGAAMLGMPFLAPYCVAKTAIARFSEVLALEYQDRGVFTFAMSPGNVLTKLTEGIYPMRDAYCANPPQGAPWILPPGHAFEDHGWYPPERGAEMCLFMASGKADALSGCFFSPHYDEQEMAANADKIRREQLYQLRLVTLNGLEPEIIYGLKAAAVAAE